MPAQQGTFPRSNAELPTLNRGSWQRLERARVLSLRAGFADAGRWIARFNLSTRSVTKPVDEYR
jgi:hypothetical protein